MIRRKRVALLEEHRKQCPHYVCRGRANGVPCSAMSGSFEVHCGVVCEAVSSDDTLPICVEHELVGTAEIWPDHDLPPRRRGWQSR